MIGVAQVVRGVGGIEGVDLSAQHSLAASTEIKIYGI